MKNPVLQVVSGVYSALAVLAMATKVKDLPPADAAKDHPLLKRPDYVTEACKVMREAGVLITISHMVRRHTSAHSSLPDKSALLSPQSVLLMRLLACHFHQGVTALQ